MPGEHSVRAAYDRFAPIYDEFNASNNYEMWLGEVLLPELERHGLRRIPGKVLDVGCGTGRAFPPLLRRGWQINGCDASPAMLDQALAHAPSPVALFECDARKLPAFAAAPFDLILVLNDVVPSLLKDGDLERAFDGFRRSLADDGLICFDTPTLGLCRSHFASGNAEEMSTGGWEWRGLSERIDPGGVYEAQVSGPGVETHRHWLRHWMPQQIEAALDSSGLRVVACKGQREEGGRILLDEPFDDERDQRMIWIAGHQRKRPGHGLGATGPIGLIALGRCARRNDGRDSGQLHAIHPLPLDGFLVWEKPDQPGEEWGFARMNRGAGLP